MVITSAAAIAVAVPLVVAGAAGPAQAADSWLCPANAWGYAVYSTTHLWRYPFTAPGTNTAAHGTPVDLGRDPAAGGRWRGRPDRIRLRR